MCGIAFLGREVIVKKLFKKLLGGSDAKIGWETLSHRSQSLHSFFKDC